MKKILVLLMFLLFPINALAFSEDDCHANVDHGWKFNSEALTNYTSKAMGALLVQRQVQSNNTNTINETSNYTIEWLGRNARALAEPMMFELNRRAKCQIYRVDAKNLLTMSSNLMFDIMKGRHVKDWDGTAFQLLNEDQIPLVVEQVWKITDFYFRTLVDPENTWPE